MIKLNINNIETLEFTEEFIKIGRNKSIIKKVEKINDEDGVANLFIKDERAISRKHCEIIQEDTLWYIHDQNSANGTYVNNIEITTNHLLKNRDKISLGKKFFIFIELQEDDNTTLEEIILEEGTILEDEETTVVKVTKVKKMLELPSSTLLNRGQYRIIKQLGAIGGFGITYLAYDTKLNSHVAIKEYFPKSYAIRDRYNQIMPTNHEDFSWGYQAFKKEASTIANLPNHNNIIGIKNLFEENNTIYYVMDYAEGEDLESYLIHNAPLTQKNIEDIIFPFLEGVKHIHKHNILHRDIKLSNILLTKSSKPILIDFGTAKEQFNKKKSQSSTRVFTEGYAAIEQHTGATVGEYTDIYAIGMLLYALINGITDILQLPSAIQRLNSHQKNSNLIFTNKNKFSNNFLYAVEKALEVQYFDRPQTIDELIKLLKSQKKSSMFNWLF